jgi:hypothetical protein
MIALLAFFGTLEALLITGVVICCASQAVRYGPEYVNFPTKPFLIIGAALGEALLVSVVVHDHVMPR